MAPVCVGRPNNASGTNHHFLSDFASTASPLPLTRSIEKCLCYATESTGLSVPLKMLFYLKRFISFVREGEHELAESISRTIPQIKELWKHLEKEKGRYQDRFVVRMEQIFLHHMRVVRNTTEEKAVLNGMRITKLAVTLPSNWDATLQKMYIELLHKVWDNISRDDVVTVWESEAVGHWLLRLDTNWRGNQVKRVIVADFGGHTLVRPTVFIMEQRLIEKTGNSCLRVCAISRWKRLCLFRNSKSNVYVFSWVLWSGEAMTDD